MLKSSIKNGITPIYSAQFQSYDFLKNSVSASKDSEYTSDRVLSKLRHFAPMSLLSTFAVMLTQVLKTLAKSIFVVDLDSSKATSRGGIFLLAFVVARKLPFCRCLTQPACALSLTPLHTHQMRSEMSRFSSAPTRSTRTETS